MTLYCRKRIVTYKDYGSFLESVERFEWCAEDGSHVSSEAGPFAATLASKRAKLPEGWTLVVLPSVSVSHDMNPHGLI